LWEVEGGSRKFSCKDLAIEERREEVATQKGWKKGKSEVKGEKKRQGGESGVRTACSNGGLSGKEIGKSRKIWLEGSKNGPIPKSGAGKKRRRSPHRGGGGVGVGGGGGGAK